MKTEFKCVVISDTHGDNRVIFNVIEKEKPFDTLIHCGDVEGSLETVLGVQTFGYFAVCGNCDMFSKEDRERCVKLGHTKVFVTHGHYFDVHFGKERLIRKAQSCQADVILYGHTHVPEVLKDKETGVLIVNPGSLSRPRQNTRRKTYAVLKISRDKFPEAVIKEL